MYFICIPVRASGNHRIRSRYNTRGAKRILAHEGGMASRQDTSKIQAKYKQDTLATGAYNLYPACIRPVSHACAVHLRARLADSSGTSGGTTCFFLGPFLTGFLPSSAGSGHV